MRKSSLALGTVLLISLAIVASVTFSISSNIVSVRANGVEVCDYVDNDGDGTCIGGSNPDATCTQPSDCLGGGSCIMADEDFILQGIPTTGWGCYGQYGVCSQCIGEVECLDTQTSICSTDPGGIDDKSSSESCNSLDDDCDGTADEELIQDCGAGDCEGEQACSEGQWGDCDSQGTDAGICAVCDADGDAVYDETQDIDCDGFSFPEIAECGHDPDSNPFTWDYSPGFASECQDIYVCTQDGESFTHTCDTAQCSAECEDDEDCLNGYTYCKETCICRLKGDVDYNQDIDIFDLAAIGLAFGSEPGQPGWNENADVSPIPGTNGRAEGDDVVDILDLAMVGANFGNAK